MTDWLKFSIRCCLIALVIGAPAAYAQEEAGTDAESASGEEAKPGSGIYRTRDKNGNVLFTDDPQRSGAEQSEEVELKRSNTLPLRVPEGALSAPESPGEGKQKAEAYSITINSPAPQQHFHNPGGPIPIQVDVKPKPTEGHALVIQYDGVTLESAEVPWPQNRGTHTITVNVVDRENNVLETASRTFYVHRASKLLPPQT